jgi:hypothetical protein
MRNRAGWILALTCVSILGAFTPARARVVDEAKQEPGAIKSMVKEAIEWYQVFVEPGATEPMKPIPVLRWRNATRGTQESEGVFVLWVNNARPEALASIYPWEGNLVHDFASLSRGSRLVARERDRVIWSPESPGVAFKDLPGARAPADTAVGRFKQMKVAADRFKVTMTGWKPDKSDREELRLLPKPLYRGERGQAPRPDDGWIDGGVFGFVQGTDPEAVLLLEAVRQSGRALWQYAFARATAAGLEARLDKTVVWEVDFLEGRTTPREPLMTLRRPLETTASGTRAAPAGR